MVNLRTTPPISVTVTYLIHPGRPALNPAADAAAVVAGRFAIILAALRDALARRIVACTPPRGLPASARERHYRISAALSATALSLVREERARASD